MIFDKISHKRFLLFTHSQVGGNEWEYRLITLFDETQFLGHDEKVAKDMQQALAEMERESCSFDKIRFNSLQELRQFSLILVEQCKWPEIYLVSSFDYNKSLESISSGSEVFPLLERIGQLIKKPAQEAEKGSLFSRFLGPKD